MQTTPAERLALGVTALLLASGAAVRMLRPEPAAVAWEEAGSAQALRGRVKGATEREREAATPLAPGERIDPNTASEAQLRRLPRVGPALAQRIIARRESRGAFRSLADLDSVPGIGPALLAAIAPHVTLPPAPSAPPPGARALQPRRAAADTPTRQTIELNSASAAELQTLPGVGPVLAERIVEWRRSRGRIRSMAELEEVRGIGPALRARLEPHLRIAP